MPFMLRALFFIAALGCCIGSVGRSEEAASAVRSPRGYFALQPGDPVVLQPGNKRIISNEQLKLPQVAGLTIRARWSWLHPGDGQFDFSFLDTHVERCRKLGKPYKILVMTGTNCSPEWIGGAWHRGAPVPWSPELAK